MKNLSVFLFIFSIVFLFLLVPKIGSDVQTFVILDEDYNTDKPKLFPYVIGAIILGISFSIITRAWGPSSAVSTWYPASISQS